VFVILISAICFLIARLKNKQLGQPVLRSIGLGLTTVAASLSFQCLWPHRFFHFPMGSGGVLGIGAAHFMRNNFASLGTVILVLAIWAVGTILLADNFILFVLHAFDFGFRKITGVAVPAWSATKQSAIVGQGLSDIWHKLSTRQKPLAVNSDLPKRSEAAPLKPINIIPVRNSETQKPGRPKAKASKSSAFQPSYDDYQLPPLDLLAEPEYGFTAVQEKVVKAKAVSLERLLSEFNINARVVAAETGPVVTMFELELAAGVKVSQIAALANDMARALGVGAVRVVAPLPGRHTIGIEVPNSEKEKVRMKSMMELSGKKPRKMQIPLFLGKDSSGEALVSDLTKMPHLLIAGTTGSGKSVCINSIITGILLTKRPDAVKLILIDPKMVEMTAFNTIPHLMCPIVTETSTAVQILEWATVKMDERYALLAEAKVKNVAEYNRLGTEEVLKRFNPSSKEEEAKIPKKLPYIVIVIDELADLMMTAAKEIEAYIVRLAQKSRAVGIHIILATQRPQATVVTGLIKSNMPTRVAFRVAARMDSRIILDQNGAETLLGEGDMLFLKPGTSDLVRAQGTFLDEPEIKKVVKHLKEIAEPQFHPELTQLKKIDPSEMVRDELFDDAVRIVLETKRGSVSLLQRRLSVGYARASRIIEMMAGAGILGEYKGSQAREVMMTLEEYENIRRQMEVEEAMEEQEAEPPTSQEPAYASEGQREYIATDSEDD
jgi:S-DNA-T family DNA segregation ATPase FtsK/SpoIIIE